MTLLKTFLISLSLFITIHTAHAQAKPNFSGNWELNLEKSVLEAKWTEGISEGSFVINHVPSQFKLDRVFKIKKKDKKQNFDLRTDGTEQSGKYKTTWSMVWKGDSLLLTVTRKGMINTVEYYLTNKDELVADERFKAGKKVYHNHWVFDKPND